MIMSDKEFNLLLFILGFVAEFISLELVFFEKYSLQTLIFPSIIFGLIGISFLRSIFTKKPRFRIIIGEDGESDISFVSRFKRM